jgi:hypothetical protein
MVRKYYPHLEIGDICNILIGEHREYRPHERQGIDGRLNWTLYE